MDISVNGPTTLNPKIQKRVWFESDDALPEGEAVCYNRDYGTITDSDGRRVNHVEPPTVDNAQWFAGVSDAAHAARTGGRFIVINCPGSVCNIRVAVSTVRNQGMLTFDLTSGVEGQFLRTGMVGRGSAIPLQTTTYVATAQTCQALLLDGPESGGVEYVVVTDIATWVSEMIGGTTLLLGRDLSQDCVEEIADGTVEGTRRRFAVVTTAFSGGFNLQVDIAGDDGVKLAGTTALAEVTMDAVGNNVTLEWKQGAWHNLGGHFTAEG